VDQLVGADYPESQGRPRTYPSVLADRSPGWTPPPAVHRSVCAARRDRHMRTQLLRCRGSLMTRFTDDPRVHFYGGLGPDPMCRIYLLLTALSTSDDGRDGRRPTVGEEEKR
jgi:hypothetical protein